MRFLNNNKVILIIVVVATVLIISTVGLKFYFEPNQGKNTRNEDNEIAETEGTKAQNIVSDNIIGQSLKYDLSKPVNGNKPITLKFWINEDWSDIYTNLIEEYKSLHPNINIEISKYTWNVYWDKLAIAAESGEAPDIFHMHNGYVIPMLQYLEPLPKEEFPIEKLEKDFLQVRTSMVGEKLYYVNVGIMTGGILYNKAYWREAGLTNQDIPKTWDELRDRAKKLTVTDNDGKIKRVGFNINGKEEYILLAMSYQKGQFLFTKDGRFSRINNAANIESVMFLRELYFKDKVGIPDAETSNEAFGEGKAAMIYAWAWAANDIERNYPSVDFGFFMLPTFWPGKPPAYDRNNVECSFSVYNSSGTSKKAVAFDLLKYYLSSDASLINAAKKAYMVPSKVSLIGRPELKENFVINEQSKYIERTCFTGILFEEYLKCLKLYLGDSIMKESANPQEVLKKADLAINKILPTYRFEPMEEKYKYASEFKKQSVNEDKN